MLRSENRYWTIKCERAVFIDFFYHLFFIFHYILFYFFFFFGGGVKFLNHHKQSVYEKKTDFVD